MSITGVQSKLVLLLSIIVAGVTIFYDQPINNYQYKIELSRYVSIVALVFFVFYLLFSEGILRLSRYDYVFFFFFITLAIVTVFNYSNKSDLNIIENVGYILMLVLPIKVVIYGVQLKALGQKLIVVYLFTVVLILIKALVFSANLNNIDGGMFNSTYFSNCIALCIPLLFYGIKNASSPILRNAIIIAIAVILFVCFLNQARASLFAALMFLFLQLKWTGSRIRIINLLGLFVISGVLFAFFYNVKLNSIKGRLFIWENCLTLLKTNPFGVGLGNFKQEYTVFQAELLNRNYRSPNFLLSDINDFAFNDALQFLIEGGILLIIPGLLLLYFVFMSKNRLLIGLCVLVSLISSTSYILHSFYPLLIITITFFVFTKDIGELKKIKSYFFVPGYLALCWAILSFMSYRVKRNINDQTISGILNGYRKLDNKYLYDWGVEELQKREVKKSIYLLKKSGMLDYDIDVNLALAYAYQSIGDLANAERHYVKGNQILPRIFKPKYYLLGYYLQQKNNSKMKDIAIEILQTPEKIPSKEIDQLKSKSRKVLDSLNSLGEFK